MADGPLRILHIVTKLEIGGAQFNTVLSANDSIKRGHSSWVIAGPGELSGYAEGVLGTSLFQIESLRREISPLNDLRAFREIVALIRELQPTIVHTHSSKAGIIGRWAAHYAKVPCVIHTAHGWAFHDRQNPIVRWIYETLERFTAGISDTIIVVADANRSKALAKGIGRPEQYVTIRSGIDLEADHLLAARNATRRDLKIPDDAFLIVSIGNFKPQKNPLEMARIVRKVLEERPKAQFISIGDGPLLRNADDLVSNSRAQFLGWRHDSSRILAASDLLLHTASFEGLPRVILEARALGIPIVSTNVDGIPEAVIHGKTGYLFAPGESEKMEETIIKLIDGSLGHSAMPLEDEFRLGTMFNRLNELYEKISR